MNPTRRSLLEQAALGAAVLGAPAVAKAQPRPKGAPRPTLIRSADVLTMDPKAGELKATDVLVRNGRIAAVGRGLAVTDAEVVDAKGMILMPGMCDGHRHVWLTIEPGANVKFDPRRYAGYQDWKLRCMAALTPEDHYLASYIGGLQAVDSGVTSVLDMAHGQQTKALALGAAKGLKDSGVGGWFDYQLGVNCDYKPGDTVSRGRANARYMTPADNGHWAAAEALASEVFTDRDAPLQLGLGPSTVIDACPMASVKADFERSRAMGVKMVAVHVSPPTWGIRDMHAQGLLGPDFHISHGTQMDDDELKMMRDTGTMLCATAMGETPYIARGIGVPMHARARAAGVAVGIGVDVPQALTVDFFEHVRAGLWSLYLAEPGRTMVESYTSTDVLDFATAGGARALRLGDVTGSITLGKRADLVLLRTDRIGFASAGSLADRVVTFASLQDIDSVWVMGRARKRHGRMIGVDWAALKAKQERAQARFRPLADSVKLV